MEINVLSLEQSQGLADNITNQVLTAIYGERFERTDNVEDDPTMNQDWESVNEKVRELINNVQPFKINVNPNSAFLTEYTDDQLAKFAQAGYDQWKRYEEQLKDMSFEEAYKELHGINLQDNMFDVSNDDSIIDITVINQNGKAFLYRNCDVWPVPECAIAFELIVNY